MKPKDIWMYLFGLSFVLEYFAVLILLIFFQLPETNEKILTYALGTLTGGALSIVNFFYGSSKGSADKTEIISGKKADA